jgi:thiol-disulfide isomerase/thioredoxin
MAAGDVRSSFRCFCFFQSDLRVVGSYATWCGHCKALAPVWALAASKAAKDTSGLVKFGKVGGWRNLRLNVFCPALRFPPPPHPTTLLMPSSHALITTLD